MKILKHPVFYITVIIGISIYLAGKLQLPIPNWTVFYVNDFLCMPIVLSLCLAVLRIIKKTEIFFVPLTIVLALTTYFALFFEWFMPQISERYSYDFIDIVLYFLGAMVFFIFQKKLF